MRLRCHLKDIRGARSLRSIALEAGVNAGQLSMIESGKLLPKDDEIPRLVAAYGRQFTDWYPPLVLVAIEVEDVAVDALRLAMIAAWVGKSLEQGGQS
jgi:transcriptional regulator with XRE-family HTH domain